LISASGKEHSTPLDHGQFDNFNDLPFLRNLNPGDPMAWRNYSQQYQYDGVGNILQMQHIANGGSWTRDYEYETDNNRLNSTTVGNSTYTYPHHEQHGFMNSMPHLSVMDWNFKDELQAVAQQVVNGGVPETTYYVYDGSGERVRKVTENSGGASIKDERLYLGGVEIYRKRTGAHAGLERITLHVMDDSSRIAMIDRRNGVDDGTDVRTIRYQFGNHLGSAALEVDETGRVLSYEEYHPFGTTAYQAKDVSVRMAAKRYRYTGMERDEETGFGYHGARYYLSWLGRWVAADKINISGGLNLYMYATNGPIRYVDLNGNEPVTIDTPGLNGDIESFFDFFKTSYDLSGHREKAKDEINKRSDISDAHKKNLTDRINSNFNQFYDRDLPKFSKRKQRFKDSLNNIASLDKSNMHFLAASVIIGAREARRNLFTKKDLPDTFQFGGFDHLFKAQNKMRRVGLLPKHIKFGKGTQYGLLNPEVTKTRKKKDASGNFVKDTTGKFVLENYHPKIESAALPAKHKFLAASARVALAFHHFKSQAKKHGFTDSDIENLSDFERNFWIAQTFSRPGGVAWPKNTPFGSITILGYLKAHNKKLSDIGAIIEATGNDRKTTNIALATAAIITEMENQMRIYAKGKTSP